MCGHAKELDGSSLAGRTRRAATSTLNQHSKPVRMQRGDGGARHFVGRMADLPWPEPSQALQRPMGIDSRVPDAGSAQASANPVAGELLGRGTPSGKGQLRWLLW